MALKNEFIYWQQGPIDTSVTADKYSFAIPQKCKVHRVFGVATTTETTALVIKFDYQPNDSDTTSRGDGDCGVLTWTTGDKQYKYFYDKPSTAAEDITLAAGGLIVTQLTTASTATKTAYVGFILEVLPETEANQVDMVASA